MAERLSLSAYARYRGCSRRAVYNALLAGRISREPDGTIDPDKADCQWAANTLPRRGGAQQREEGADLLEFDWGDLPEFDLGDLPELDLSDYSMFLEQVVFDQAQSLLCDPYWRERFRAALEEKEELREQPDR